MVAVYASVDNPPVCPGSANHLSILVGIGEPATTVELPAADFALSNEVHGTAFQCGLTVGGKRGEAGLTSTEKQTIQVCRAS